MTEYQGNPVGGGVVRGSVTVLEKQELPVTKKKTETPEGEIRRVEEAVALAREQLQKLYELAVVKAGEENAAIFAVHQMMLEDEEFLHSIIDKIRKEEVNAEYAVYSSGTQLSETFAAMDDKYMKARSIDIRDITDRLIRNLTGTEEITEKLEKEAVILADDLTPSQMLQLDREQILALVTVHGSVDSHTSILARWMKIPAVAAVPLEISQLPSGTEVMVDGIRGTVIVYEAEETDDET